ncbi:MAG: peptide chain release factor N(5)-glutamine methyltransferase [Candidatus Saccharicenans sp.]
MRPETLDQIFRRTAARLSFSACPFIESRLLIQLAGSMDESQFFRQLNSPVSKILVKRLEPLVRKRLAGWPLAYILGEKEFWSLRFEVGPQVLIPRPETELVVEKVLSLPLSDKPRLLDVGTGCGNIAIALAKELPQAKVIGSDLSKRALAVAEVNARKIGLKNVKFIQSDLLDYFLKKRQRFEVIVSNPPYVSEADWEKLDSPVKDFEPRKALVAGPTGLEVINRLIDQARYCLIPGGYLVFEFGAGQEKQLLKLFPAGWGKLEILQDYSGLPRVASVSWPGKF